MSLTWRAIYTDGSFLDQYNADGTENKYTSIDRTRLSKFLLLRETKPVFVLHLRPGQRLIHRRRVSIRLGARAGRETVWIVGFQENRNGVNIQSIAFVFEDGHVELMDRFREDHVLYYPVIFLPEEVP